jgi:dTDP-4-dehydrorhamnose 3,5-epimerase
MPHRYTDARGQFVEMFNKNGFFEETGFDGEFVQDNQSRSRKGVLRGLHYQIEPHAQGKLVRAVAGVVFDVAVDIRRTSPTFGDWFGFELSAEKGNQVWIPPGFAHGILALTDGAELLYKVTEYHSPDHERSIRWDDPAIGIVWPTADIDEIHVSERDTSALLLRDAEVFA